MIFKIFLFFLSFFLTNSIFAKSYPLIHVCSEAGFFPFEMRTPTGEWIGYDIALIKNFAADTGRTIKLVDMKFDGLIPSLIANKNCDIVASAVGINAQREKIVLFSEPSYSSAFAGIVRAAEVKKYDRFEKINQKGVNIAVEQGTESAEYVKNKFKNANILMYEDNSVPVNAVIANKADIYIDDAVYLSIAVKRKISALRLIPSIIFPGNVASGMGFAFRRKDKNLRDEFNQYFNKIKKNGKLDELQKFYFQDMDWMK